MIIIPIELPDELAREVLPLQERLPEIIKLGLQYWKQQAPSTPRERAELLWEAAGLLEPVVVSGDDHPAQDRQLRTPIHAGGQPASEIVIEQRGAL